MAPCNERNTLSELSSKGRDLAFNALGVQAPVRESGVQAARQSVVLEIIRRRADEPSRWGSWTRIELFA